MFQDDRMISFLTAIIVMIALGTVVQRSDGLTGIFSPPKPAMVLVDDAVPVVAGKLRRIDVFANDQNVSMDDRISLQIARQPDCGQVFIQGDIIQYLAAHECAGRQSLTYTVEGIDPPVVAEVVAFVKSDVKPLVVVQEDKKPSEPANEEFGVSDEPETEVAVADTETETGQPTIAQVLGGGAADTANAGEATDELLRQPLADAEFGVADDDDTGSDASLAESAVSDDEQPIADATLALVQTEPELVEPLVEPSTTTVDQLVPTETANDDDVQALVVKPAPTEVVIEQPEPQEEVEQLALAQPTAPEIEPLPVGTATEQEQELILTPVRLFEPASPGGTLVSSKVGRINQPVDRSPRIASVPSIASAEQVPALTDFKVAIIPLSEPVTDAPAILSVRTVIDRQAPSVSPGADQPSDSAQGSVRLATVDPDQAVAGRVAPALSGDPVDPNEQPFVEEAVLPAELHPIPKQRDTAALQAALQQDQAVERDTAAQPLDDSGEGTKVAALPSAVEACVTPPATTIDVSRAAESTISIVAPCHANTIAELTYSGLRFAVPLNGEGKGSIDALGFEANSPALLIFDNGEKIDFDLPFKGINRVSRVAMVWDVPVALELNALEFGAKPGSERHVSPANPRDFSAVRKEGGGYLRSFRSYSGIGQNAQIYTFFARRGAQGGIVKLMIDFASRNRDLLDGTCGTGRYAAPQFLVLRSDKGRLQRPVLRKLAALSCSDVPAEKGDKRLISDAVADLVVSR